MAPVLTLDEQGFGLFGAPLSMAGELSAMRWKPGNRGQWVNPSPYIASTLWGYVRPDDTACRQILGPYAWNYQASFSDKPLAGTGIDQILFPQGSSPFNFQLGGVQLAARQRATIIGDQPGLGKSMQAIGVANIRQPRRILVGCPTHLTYNWAAQFEKWYVHRAPITVLDNAKKAVPTQGIVIMPYSRGLSFWPRLLASGPFDLVIPDEFHELKNEEAQRSRPWWGWGDQPGVINHAGQTVLLSGTPQLNNPGELYNAVASCRPDLVRGINRDKWADLYCNVHKFTMPVAPGSSRTREIEKVEGGKYDLALNAELRASGLLVRRLKSDVLDQLPPKQTFLVHLPPSGRIAQLAKEEADLYEMIKAKAFTHAELMHVQGHIATVRRELGVLKAPLAAQFILEKFVQGETHVVAFGLHTEALDTLARILTQHGIKVHVADGRASPRKRHAMMEDFQEGRGPQVYLGQVIASGTGTTLTRARCCVMFESAWTPGRNEQAHDRVHRISQTNNVEIDILTFPHGVETRVLASGATKELSAKRVLDTRVTEMLLAYEEAA